MANNSDDTKQTKQVIISRHSIIIYKPVSGPQSQNISFPKPHTCSQID